MPKREVHRWGPHNVVLSLDSQVSLNQQCSNLIMHENHPEGLQNQTLFPWFRRSGVRLKKCISNKFPDAAGSNTLRTMALNTWTDQGATQGTKLVLLRLSTTVLPVDCPDSGSRGTAWVAGCSLPRPWQDACFEAINVPVASLPSDIWHHCY